MDRVGRVLRALTPRRRRNGKGDRGVRIASAGLYVGHNLFLDRPLVAALVGEDTAWQIAVSCWSSRRPHWWHLGVRRAWSREGQALETKRLRLCRQAFYLGLCVGRPVPVAGVGIEL